MELKSICLACNAVRGPGQGSVTMHAKTLTVTSRS
jgi:hypothetical protein